MRNITARSLASTQQQSRQQKSTCRFHSSILKRSDRVRLENTRGLWWICVCRCPRMSYIQSKAAPAPGNACSRNPVDAILPPSLPALLFRLVGCCVGRWWHCRNATGFSPDVIVGPAPRHAGLRSAGGLKCHATSIRPLGRGLGFFAPPVWHRHSSLIVLGEAWINTLGDCYLVGTMHAANLIIV
jgi:hypothetical protein